MRTWIVLVSLIFLGFVRLGYAQEAKDPGKPEKPNKRATYLLTIRPASSEVEEKVDKELANAVKGRLAMLGIKLSLSQDKAGLKIELRDYTWMNAQRVVGALIQPEDARYPLPCDVRIEIRLLRSKVNFEWKRVTSSGKLLALRAAQVDAYRLMSETILGLRLSDDAMVKDFVHSSDEIRTEFKKVLLKIFRFAEKWYYHPAGHVEVTGLIDREELIKELSEIARRHYRGKKWSPESFHRLRSLGVPRVIRSSGRGSPPKKCIKSSKSGAN
jgi:hypothetical protein